LFHGCEARFRVHENAFDRCDVATLFLEVGEPTVVDKKAVKVLFPVNVPVDTWSGLFSVT
jgi:hypothetical protein